MTRVQICRGLLFAGVLASFAATNVFAGDMTTPLQTVSFSGTMNYDVGDSNAITVPFTQFDPSLGTLEAIDFSVDGSIVETVTFTNTNTASKTVQNVTLDATLDMQDPSGDTVTTAIPSYAVGNVTVPGTNAGPGNNNITVSTGDPGPSASTTEVYLLSSGTIFDIQPPPGNVNDAASIDVTPFIGTSGCSITDTCGTIDLFGEGDASYGETAQPNGVTGSPAGTASGTFTLQYTYLATPIVTPEPATLFLFGGALVAIGVAKRRKKA